ncbi:MAG: resuscitation-promoting factor RpfE [Solirubrobacteraceae bacterium]|nr:resuscitation-promoting factor RpfE [Solirubrobacteraceae bacterium]
MSKRHIVAAASALALAPTAANAAAPSKKLERPSLGVLRHIAAAAAKPHSTASPALQAIAACESGGDPTAVDASGTYRGKYQFDQGTWESVGGTGDPAAAPEAEQDRRAQILMSRAGSSPWPVCG